LSENFEVNPRPLDGFMIGRSSFGNPWCFDPEGKKPTFIEILAMMRLHAKWLIETKGKK
jgi:tRNA-dihydrouridine synthase